MNENLQIAHLVPWMLVVEWLDLLPPWKYSALVPLHSLHNQVTLGRLLIQLKNNTNLYYVSCVCAIFQ